MEKWFGLAALCISIAHLVKSYGYDKGKLDQWQKGVDQSLQSHSKKHDIHFLHMGDDEVHWTKRERDENAKQMDRIEELIRESMMPRADRKNWKFPDV